MSMSTSMPTYLRRRSLPQGVDKTPSELAEFGQQLPNINLLYLGCTVLILLDRSYCSRFWQAHSDSNAAPCVRAHMHSLRCGRPPVPSMPSLCTERVAASWVTPG